MAMDRRATARGHELAVGQVIVTEDCSDLAPKGVFDERGFSLSSHSRVLVICDERDGAAVVAGALEEAGNIGNLTTDGASFGVVAQTLAVELNSKKSERQPSDGHVVKSLAPQIPVMMRPFQTLLYKAKEYISPFRPSKFFCNSANELS